MAMRSSASRLYLLAGRAVGAALRPMQSAALYSTTSDTQPISDKDYLLGTLPETMKAAVLWEPRKPMTVEELKMPRPQIGEVLIKTKGATPSTRATPWPEINSHCVRRANVHKSDCKLEV